MRKNQEKGVALIFALIMVLLLSALAVSLMYVARSETVASQNYKTMTQARYGAETAVNNAANWFMYQYTPPTTATGFFYNCTTAGNTNYLAITTGPNCGGTPVYLSADTNIAATYPV